MVTTPTRLRAILHLKTGEHIDISMESGRKFKADSFVVSTLHVFLNRDQSKKYLVQGDNISYLESLD